MQIDFDGLRNGSFLFPACRSGSTQICKPASMVRCFISKPGTGGGRGPAAVAAAMNCRVIVSAIVARRHLLVMLPLTRSAPIVASSFIAPRGGGGQGGGPGGGGGTASGATVVSRRCRSNSATTGSGRLNFALRMYLEPKEEFKQIFNEGWRNQRDYLYVPNMHGTDWPKMRQMYGQLLPYVMHRADLNYLMDMMGAEIAVGHSYVRGGDMPTVPQPVAGLLGADFVIENGRYKVTRIYDNESWNPDLRSPLATPGANVNTGDYILAINGIELERPTTFTVCWTEPRIVKPH